MERSWLAPPPEARRVLVTGGAGFIGSSLLNLLVPAFPNIAWVNLDKLTYAGNLRNLDSIASLPNYEFIKVDLADRTSTGKAVGSSEPDWIFHFAAETHVDRSIRDPGSAIEANYLGTFHLLEAAREHKVKLFHHIGTDEVFGALGLEGAFDEKTRYDPSNPYSASKAGSDHLVRAWRRTYGMDVRVTNCSNNYGPRQFPEKLIPLMILNAAAAKELPVYGKGKNIRDWLYVEDHVEAVWTVACLGKPGDTYVIGGGTQATNVEIVGMICDSVARRTGGSASNLRELIRFVPDRPGHDFRYAIDSSRVRAELGWAPRVSLNEGIETTVNWYLGNPEWVESVRSGEYMRWMEEHYGESP